MAYRLVSFDFDGTLADSFPWFCSVLNAVADRYGFRAVAPEEIAGLRGASNREILKRLGIPLWKLPFIARHMRREAGKAAGDIALFPGIAELIEALAARDIRIAIVSSNAETTVRAVLGPVLAARIAYFGCSASMFGKPAKLRKMLRRLDIAPENALHVGDEDRDISAARAVGMNAASVGWGYADPAHLKTLAPDIHAETPAALLERLD